jgi:ligand-binding sensor domain-containing protein
MKILIKILLIVFLGSGYYKFAYADWKECNGPYGGTINTFLLVNDSLYAGTNNGGLFLLKNNNNEWTGFLFDSSDTKITSVNSIIKFRNSVLIGTNNGLYKLDTNTNKLKKNDTILSNEEILTISCFDSLIFAGTLSNHIYVTSENDFLWSRCDSGINETGFGVQSICKYKDRIFAAVHSNGVYCLDSLKSKWEKINNGLNNLQLFNLFSWNDFLFIATGSGIYKIKDDNKSWEKTDTSLNNPVYCMASYKEKIFLATVNGIRFSSDSGKSFEWDKYFGFGPVKSIIVKKDIIFAGSFWNGVYSKNVADTIWEESNNKLTGTKILTLSHDSNIVIAGSDYGLFISKDYGQTWKRAKLPSGIMIGSVAVKGKYMLAGCYYGLYLSEDTGNTWQEISKQLEQKDIQAISFGMNQIFAGSLDGYVFCSKDSGKTWQKKVYSNLTGKIIRKIFVDDSLLWLATSQGVFVSFDTAKTFKDLNYGNFPYNSYCLVKRKNEIYCGTNNGMFYAKNIDSLEWMRVDSFPFCLVRSLALKDTVILASTDFGVLKSEDGILWTQCGSLLENKSVYSIDVLKTGILAGTAKQGVWFLQSIPTKTLYSLQNKKVINPTVKIYNKKLKISFLEIPKTKIIVSFIKVNGRLIFSNTFSPKCSNISIDFSDYLNSYGVYFVNIKYNNKNYVYKIIMP